MHMVTDQYAHIMDEDRRFNAKKMNDDFYIDLGLDSKTNNYIIEPKEEGTANDVKESAKDIMDILAKDSGISQETLKEIMGLLKKAI